MRKYLIMALLGASILSSCKQEAVEVEDAILRQEVTVMDGHMTPEALWAMGRISGVSLSPDKSKILYTVAYYSVEKNKSHRTINIMNADGTDKKLLTTGAASDMEAVWADDNTIAFISADKEGISQVFIMAFDGSSRRQISHSSSDVEGFKFSPDMKKVILLHQIPFNEIIKKNSDDLPKATGMVITDLMYRHWDEYVTTIPHPFVANVEDMVISTEEKDILEGEPYESPLKPFGGIEQLAWSKDSKQIAYTCRKKIGKEYAFSTDSDIYLYDTESGNTVNLCKDFSEEDKNMGYDINPSFSPDGKKIAWQSMERDGYESDRNRLCVMDLESKSKTYVTESFDSGVDEYIWLDDSQTILFTGVWHGCTMIYKTNLQGEVKKITDGQYDYSIADATEKDAIALRHSMMAPDDIYTVSLYDGQSKQLTEENSHILSQLHLGNVEPRWVTTTDNKQMLYWVIYPSDFDPSKKYPTLLFCEGGPQSPVSQFWSYRWNFQIMAANGYVIIAPNRRGLPGFGTEWLEQISGDYTGQCMKDYLTAIDDACNLDFVDKDRLGCVGASFGGYSVYWLAGHHDKRFKAFIAHDGIFNTQQQYIETEEMWFAQWDMKAPYWDKTNASAQKTYADSPHLSVDKWDTPILCIQGDKDYRIMTNQAMSAFNAAQMRGVPSELLLFPDENHWVLKPQNGILWQRTFFSWLDKWLKK